MEDALAASDGKTPMFTAAGRARRAKVVSVHDGDTVHANMLLDGDTAVRRYILRLDGIDTPELRGPNAALAAAARAELSRLVLGRVVDVDLGKSDRYGRILARIHVDDIGDVGAALVRGGLASEYHGRGGKFDALKVDAPFPAGK